MAGWEAAEDGDIVGLEILQEHGFWRGEGELVVAVGELAEDDSAAAVEDAGTEEESELAVDVVHGLFDILDEEDEAVGGCGVGRSVEVGGESGEVAADENAGGFAGDVERMGRELIDGERAEKEVAEEERGGVVAAECEEGGHGGVERRDTGVG